MKPVLHTQRWCGQRLLRLTTYYSDGSARWHEQWLPGYRHPHNYDGPAGFQVG